MTKISYRRHRFPPEIIQHAVWLYFRFPPSFRDVEDLLAERGIDVSYETVRPHQALSVRPPVPETLSRSGHNEGAYKNTTASKNITSLSNDIHRLGSMNES